MSNFNVLRASIDQMTAKELQILREEIDMRLQNTSVDWLDTEYVEEAKKEMNEKISLEVVRETLAKIKSSASDMIISEREDRL